MRAPRAVFTALPAVVIPEDHGRILREAEPVEGVEQPADLGVDITLRLSCLLEDDS